MKGMAGPAAGAEGPLPKDYMVLRCDGNARNSFSTTQGKDPPLELAGGNGATLDMDGTLRFL